MRYDWYQSLEFVTITVFVKHVNFEQSVIKLEENSSNVLSIDLVNTDGHHTLLLSLWDHVDQIDSFQIQTFSSKVEIKLKKRTAFNWPSLTRSTSDDQLVSKHIAATTTTAKVLENSQSDSNQHFEKKKGLKNPTDWNAIEKEYNEILKEEEDAKKAAGGEEALQQLLSSIYQSGNDETRKAMLKSYQESGGKSLSTNWDDVKSKNFSENNK
jgi:suppressor of G2 allele of SKP1